VSPSGAHDDTIICFPQTVQLNEKPSEVLVEVSISRLRVVPPLQRNKKYADVGKNFYNVLHNLAVPSQKVNDSVDDRQDWSKLDQLIARILPTAKNIGQPKLFDEVRNRFRLLHPSKSTEEAYVGWIRRYLVHAWRG